MAPPSDNRVKTNNGNNATTTQHIHLTDKTNPNWQSADYSNSDFLIKTSTSPATSIKQPLPGDYFAFTQNPDNEAPRHLKVVFIRPKPHLNRSKQVFKRGFDIVFSVIVMIVGFPLFVLLCAITKFSSPGPIFYKQERIGRNRRKFFIHKLRSMHVNAEDAGPQLSRTGDPRITKWGHIIRRTRMDELPQFWNVLKGDMSIVGPRPERQHFIDQIMVRRSDYGQLQSLRPGITSSGQVNYGYAENVDQMCERINYDLHYLNNISLKHDIKVIIKTIRVVFQAKGK